MLLDESSRLRGEFIPNRLFKVFQGEGRRSQPRTARTMITPATTRMTRERVMVNRSVTESSCRLAVRQDAQPP